MDTIPGIAEAIRTVLTMVADTAARPTGFVQRASKLTGPLFVLTLVLGWLKNPKASLTELTRVAADLGVSIKPQALDQRFTPRAAALLEEVLNAAVTRVVGAEPVAIPLLQRFSAVMLQDSSAIGLPEALAEKWPGCGNQTAKADAAVKIQVRLDVLNGTIYGPVLEAGRTQDKGSTFQHRPLPMGALRIADLGYFSLEALGEVDGQDAFYLSRLWPQTAMFNEEGKRLNLPRLLSGSDRLDVRVRIGIDHRLPVRLLAVRVPEEVAAQRRGRLRAEARRRCQPVSMTSLALASWTILVTNVPRDKLSLEEALVLARVRWQIELLFKLWKQHGKVDEWSTENPWRILCEVYAKLIAMVLQHWLILTACWAYPDRSLVKAAQVVRDRALLLILAMAGALPLVMVLREIQRALSSGSRMNPRKKHPNTYQLLMTCLEEVA